MGKTKKKQHYIPQLQLRYFACDPNKEYVYVFDKKKMEKRRARICDVAVENNFYSPKFGEIIEQISSDDVKKVMEENFIKSYQKTFEQFSEEEKRSLECTIENLLSDYIEPNLKQIYEAICNRVSNLNSNIFIADDEKKELSSILAISYYRSMIMRNFISSHICEDGENTSVITIHGDKVPLGTISKKEWVKIMQGQMIINELKNSNLTNILYSYEWILLINKSKILLCLSDNPILMPQTSESLMRIDGKLRIRDIITFPITPFISILMYSKKRKNSKFLKNKEDMHCYICDDDTYYENINLQMMKQCNRYCFFANEDILSSSISKFKDLIIKDCIFS